MAAVPPQVAQAMAAVQQQEEVDVDQTILDMHQLVINIKTAVDGNTPVIASLGHDMADVKAMLRQLIDRAQASPVQQAVMAGGAPIPGMSQGMPQILRGIAIGTDIPAMMQVSTRPYKKSGSSNCPSGWAPNTTALYPPFLQLAHFEATGIVGARDATVDIILCGMLGFRNGIEPFNWDAPIADPMRAQMVSAVRKQKATIETVLNFVTTPGYNMTDGNNKDTISNAQKTLGKMLTFSQVPDFSHTRDNLAELFQTLSTQPGTIYTEASNRTGSKVPLGSTFLGIAWLLRLPVASRSQVPFQVPASPCIPPAFSLGARVPITAAPTYIQSMGGQPFMGQNIISQPIGQPVMQQSMVPLQGQITAPVIVPPAAGATPIMATPITNAV